MDLFASSKFLHAVHSLHKCFFVAGFKRLDMDTASPDAKHLAIWLIVGGLRCQSEMSVSVHVRVLEVIGVSGA